MITEITDKMAVVFSVQELCFVPEFDALYNQYGEFALYVLILYAHPSSPYRSVTSKKERFYLILSDSAHRFNELQKRDKGFYKVQLDDLLGSMMEIAIDKYTKLLPVSEPTVIMRMYQRELERVMEQIADINLESPTGVKDMQALIAIEKAMTIRIGTIGKEIAKRYMSDARNGSPSSLVQDIQNMTAASKRKI